MNAVRILVLSLLLSALAGCANTSTSPAVDPAPVPEIPEIHILPGGSVPSAPGPFYSISDLKLTTPATVRFVNDDNVYHRIVGQVSSAAAPIWAIQALGAAGHAHGGPSIVVDIELEPGATAEVQVPLDGEISIHCHPHPWMGGHWSASPNGTHDYPVAVGSLRMTGEATGSLEAGASKQYPLVLRQNVREVRANLTWDDSTDDGTLGEPGNAPDTFILRLVDPDGNEAARANATARMGFIEAIFTTPAVPWPKTIPADNRASAEAALRSQTPDDVSWSGYWTISLKLAAAPGPVPDESGNLNVAPSTDGKQAWALQVETIQEWVVIGIGKEVLRGTWALAD